MKKILILICITSLLCGCQKINTAPIPTEAPTAPSIQKVNHYFESIPDIQDEYIPMLNTMVRLLIENEEYPDELINKSDSILIQLHQLMDGYHYYRDESDELIHNIRYLNDYYGLEAVEVSEELICILEQALQMAKLSEGYFNPFMGSLINLWAPRFSAFPIENSDPDEKEIEQAKACVPTLNQMDDLLIIDKESNTVLFNKLEGCNDKVILNLGAFSKGYAAHAVHQSLNEYSADYLFDAGTSTLVVSGNRLWTAGIRSPYNKVSSIYALELTDGLALSSSGDDNNYFLLPQEDGTTIVRCHILNPFTGVSENYYRSVTVVCKNSTIADVLSTALFSIDDEHTIQTIIHKFEEAYQLNIEAGFIIETDAELQQVQLKTTSEFKNYMLSDYITDHIVEIKELP